MLYWIIFVCLSATTAVRGIGHHIRILTVRADTETELAQYF